MKYEINLDLEVSRAQYDILTFRAPPTADGEPQTEEVGILGEYGGGKTRIGAERYMIVCADNTGIGTERDPLMCGISAPTGTGMTNGPLAAIDKVINRMTGGVPERLVMKDRRGNTKDPHILLRNGIKIILYTGRGALDGPNLFQFWADEIQDSCYVGQWANMIGRVRDKRARRLNAQASGIAEEGYVAQIFRNPPKDGCHCTKLLFPEDNEVNLSFGYADRVKAASAGGRRRDPDGWMTPDLLFYPMFCRERNIDPVTAPRESLYPRSTDLSIDLGARAAVTWWQPVQIECDWGTLGWKTETGWLCVDQWLPNDLDADAIANIAKDFPWAVTAGVSEIHLDPTAESDQVKAIARAFPGVRINMTVRNTLYWDNEPGERAVARAVLDMHDNTRLFVHPDLVADPSGRGVVEAMRGYKRDKPQDKKLEHVADTVRYLAAHRMPLPKRSIDERQNPVLEAALRSAYKPIAPKMGEIVY